MEAGTRSTGPEGSCSHVRLVQGYGLSETGFLSGSAGYRATRRTSSRFRVGRPCPGDRSASRGSVRNRSFRWVSLANWWLGKRECQRRGYWKNPEETTLAFQDGFFRNGRSSAACQDADGYFYILDRLKDMIVTGGENVYSGEVEAVIFAHPAVREAAVFGIPDPQWGELVTACVVLKPGEVLSADDLMAYCRRSLANYKIPQAGLSSWSIELPKSGLSAKFSKGFCVNAQMGPMPRNGP